jgi:hypothetical protein
MELVEQLGQARREGLTAEQIARLPTIIFKAKEHKGEDDMLSCIVCMNEYKNQEKLRVLPCNHRFHKACIDKWLKVCYPNNTTGDYPDTDLHTVNVMVTFG